MTIQATYAIADLATLTSLTNSQRVDGYSRLVKSDAEGNQNWFTYIANSSAVANADTILIPDDNPTTGRWFKHTGVLPVLVIGAVTTLTAGSAATASVNAVSGQANTYQINLGIPRGANGSSGGGSSGSTSWIVQNSDYTASSGDQILATNAWQLTLPPTPFPGDNITLIKTDAAATTIATNGSPVKGQAITSCVFSNQQELFKLIYKDSTSGWIPAPDQLDKRSLFTYSSDGDANGVFYWLGTNKGAADWTNPYTLGTLAIRSVDTASGSYDLLVDRQPSDFYTSNNQNRWIEFDLGPNQLIINYFSYRARSSDNNYIASNLILSGSDDGVNYINIGTYNTGLSTASSWFSQAVSGQAKHSIYRFTQPATSYFTAGEFELYGTYCSKI